MKYFFRNLDKLGIVEQSIPRLFIIRNKKDFGISALKQLSEMATIYKRLIQVTIAFIVIFSLIFLLFNEQTSLYTIIALFVIFFVGFIIYKIVDAIQEIKKEEELKEKRRQIAQLAAKKRAEKKLEEKRHPKKISPPEPTWQEKLEKIAREHAHTLATLRKQLVYKDDFNMIILDKWNEKVDYFINKVARKIIFSCNDTNIYSKYISSYSFNEAYNIVEKIALEELKNIENAKYSDSMTGVQYERFCGEILEREYWEVKYTKASGDQGVDILASKNGVVCAIQCKKHQNPVGNKAIQEVVAGQTYYNADYAIVVASNGFTKSAEQLALTTNTILLNHLLLPNIDNYIPILNKTTKINEQME